MHVFQQGITFSLCSLMALSVGGLIVPNCASPQTKPSEQPTHKQEVSMTTPVTAPPATVLSSVQPDLSKEQAASEKNAKLGSTTVSIQATPPRDLALESASRSTEDEAFIPGGVYTTGPFSLCSKYKPEKRAIELWGPECPSGYFPPRTVTLKSYFLDKTEVTLADYAECEKVKACPKITSDMLKG